MTRDAGFKRRVRARMAKTGERKATARTHLDRSQDLASRTFPSSTLHVTNGDSAVFGLQAAGVDGDILAWRDVLHEGPVPTGLTAEQLRAVRAAYLEREGFARAHDVAASFAARDTTFEVHRGGPYVLWFEADLYDQLQLIQVVQRLAQLGVDPTRVMLVSIGEYPGIAHFGGLGELAPEALARVSGDGLPLTNAAVQLATDAWAAFTAPEPTALPTIARQRTPELRFLGEAFARLMREYPSRSDGLSLTERRILLAIDEGAGIAGEVFRAIWQQERRPYLGGSSCFAIMRRLAVANYSLLAFATDQRTDFAQTAVRLTEAGADVLAGRNDHVRLNGIDRWIGGVELRGTQPAWRYDERMETIVNV
jgi:Domain of unknown function (DUF1835)